MTWFFVCLLRLRVLKLRGNTCLTMFFYKQKIRQKRLNDFFYNYGEINFNFSFYFLSKSDSEEIRVDLRFSLTLGEVL